MIDDLKKDNIPYDCFDKEDLKTINEFIGSSFESFLNEEGVEEEIHEAAVKEVVARRGSISKVDG